MANVTDFGADPSGQVDSTRAFSEAIATGQAVYVPAGRYRLTDMITLNNGQLMYGDDRDSSQLLVNAETFNLKALAVVRLATSEPGASIRDLGISFSQPDQGSRANLVPFPPAIYAQSTPRFQMTRIRVSAGNIGLDARGNSGGAQIEQFECSAFTAGMLWGSPPGQSNAGAKDFVHIRDFHFWNFGIPTSGQLWTVFHDGKTLAASLGEIDGLDASGFTLFAGTIQFTADAKHGWYDLVNLMCDDLTSVAVAGAKFLQISTLYIGSPGTLSVSGGEVIINNAWITAAGDTPIPPVQVTGGEVSIIGGWLNTNNNKRPFATVRNGMLGIKSARLAPLAALFSAPYIHQQSGALVVENCDFVGGSGVGIAYDQDNASNAARNVTMPNWTLTVPHLPTAQLQGRYQGVNLP